MLKIEEEKKRLPPSKPKYNIVLFVFLDDFVLFRYEEVFVWKFDRIIGPKIVYRSTQKEETVTFTDVDELPPFLNCKPIPCMLFFLFPPYDLLICFCDIDLMRECMCSDPNRNVCEITGLPAKYLDPKTKIPFATLEAFKHIRNRYFEIDSLFLHHSFERKFITKFQWTFW